MNEKLFISKIRVYRTPNGKTKYSVGMSIANRLNGDGFFTGTYDDSDKTPLMVGFIVSREKFDTEAEALEHVKALKKLYPIGFVLGKSWAWDKAKADDTEALHADDPKSAHVTVHIVKYKGTDVTSSIDDINVQY